MLEQDYDKGRTQIAIKCVLYRFIGRKPTIIIAKTCLFSGNSRYLIIPRRKSLCHNAAMGFVASPICRFVLRGWVYVPPSALQDSVPPQHPVTRHHLRGDLATLHLRQPNTASAAIGVLYVELADHDPG